MVARLLERTVASVEAEARRQRVSLRRDGERRGIRMGQPRGVKLADLGNVIAEDVRAGRFDLLVAEREIVTERTAPLCSCGFHPVQVASTGLCRICHLKRLIEKHREQATVDKAQRELWKARQDKRRARTCESCGGLFHPRPTSTATVCPECAS